MSSKENKQDDLTQIKGVGKVRQDWFKKVLKVETLQEFAALSADEIESQMKREGQIISRDEIEQWLTQAQNLAPPQKMKAEESSKMKDNNEKNAPQEKEQWEWLNAFVIEFCALKSAVSTKKREIRVYPLKISKEGDWLENGGSKKTPKTFTDYDLPWTWMLEQINTEEWQKPKTVKAIPKPPKPTKAPAETSVQINVPTIDTLPTVKIHQIRAYQPPDVNRPAVIGEVDQPFLGSVRSDKPFALEVEFAISEMISDETARSGGYRAEFHARQMNSKTSFALGETMLDLLFRNRLSYTARLPQTRLKPGIYHLGAQVKFRSRPPKVTYLELPMFQVE